MDEREMEDGYCWFVCTDIVGNEAKELLLLENIFLKGF